MLDPLGRTALRNAQSSLRLLAGGAASEAETFGFNSFGEQLIAVKKARAGTIDPRLHLGAAAPGTFGSEGIGADGGFAVAPGFKDQIFVGALGTGDNFSVLCDINTTQTNSMAFPSDESTPWGTTGVRAQWYNAEGTLLPAIKPTLRDSIQRLNKLIVYVPATEELITDPGPLGKYMVRKAGEAFAWKMCESITRGGGNGTPLGFLNSPALIVVAKDSGQAVNTVSVTNLSNMLARLPPGSFSKAVWLVDITTLGPLLALNATGQVFFPNGGDVAGEGGTVASLGTLLGRPVIVTSHCAALSAQGDICLADLSYYRLLTKSPAVATDISLHVYFDAGAGAFRFVMRIDGAPSIANPIAPPKGSTNMSPFVALGAR